jgi:hypothetical protein
VVDEDQERQFSPEREPEDYRRVHVLWFERAERRAKDKYKRQQMAAYATYLSAAGGIIALLTFLRGYIASFFHASP